MLYNQPYGISDPNAAYINGNPTTGTMGSIPPAASIEFDQREIVEVINYAYAHGYKDNTGTPCAAPTNADLTQLRKAIWGFILSDKLTLNLNYYVNNTGSDTANDGLTAGTPFATVQKAVDMANMFDPNGFTITIHVADGTYAPWICGKGGTALKGFGTIDFIGNITNPQNCLVTSTTNGVIFTGQNRNYRMGGFKIVNTGPTPLYGYGILAQYQSTVTIYNIDFGQCNLFQMWNSNSLLLIAGMIDQIPNVAYPFIRVSGGGGWHMRASEGGEIGSHCPDMNILNPVAFTGGWALVDTAGINIVVSDPFGSQPNYYNSIVNKANVTAGTKYQINMNSILNTNGSGASYFPGSTAGAVSTGGQYL